VHVHEKWQNASIQEERITGANREERKEEAAGHHEQQSYRIELVNTLSLLSFLLRRRGELEKAEVIDQHRTHSSLPTAPHPRWTRRVRFPWPETALLHVPLRFVVFCVCFLWKHTKRALTNVTQSMISWSPTVMSRHTTQKMYSFAFFLCFPSTRASCFATE
jgi:hypothetical protein